MTPWAPTEAGKHSRLNYQRSISKMGETEKKGAKAKAAKQKRIPDPQDTTMSLGDHLEELRARLILAILGLAAALIVCLFFGKWIILFIEVPYYQAMGQEKPLQVIEPVDGFLSYMKISLIAGVVLSSPWIFYQIWLFIAAGLYPRERRYVYLAVPFSTGLFIAGALLFILVIAPATLKFLVMFNRRVLEVESNFTFKSYVSFVSTMMLVFGIAFQTPIAIFFLNKTGLVSIQSMRKSRKFVVLGSVIAAAVATPGGDFFSLFTLAIPLYLLFEFGIVLSVLSARRKKLPDKQEQPQPALSTAADATDAMTD
jgi:sec-independent protein translocase protein TatC